jgi:hypothetical protein
MPFPLFPRVYSAACYTNRHGSGKAAIKGLFEAFRASSGPAFPARLPDLTAWLEQVANGNI